MKLGDAWMLRWASIIKTICGYFVDTVWLQATGLWCLRGGGGGVGSLPQPHALLFSVPRVAITS